MLLSYKLEIKTNVLVQSSAAFPEQQKQLWKQR
jgi:hypothetical protein